MLARLDVYLVLAGFKSLAVQALGMMVPLSVKWCPIWCGMFRLALLTFDDLLILLGASGRHLEQWIVLCVEGDLWLSSCCR